MSDFIKGMVQIVEHGFSAIVCYTQSLHSKHPAKFALV